MRPGRCLLLAACLLAAAAARAATESYEYDYAYDGAYDETADDYLEDDYGYYENDDEAYYEEYGYYSDDDAFGYADYYDEYYDYNEPGDIGTTTCSVDKDGKVKLANGTAPCDIKLSGVDKQADASKLTGGLDGVYKLTGCHNGRPLYKREKSPAGEERVLWYSQTFGDWDISKGPEPNEEDILMYGGDMEHQAVPLWVASWHLGADLKAGASPDAGDGEDSYLPVAAALACADGKAYEPPAVVPAVTVTGPILTDAEIEAKYKLIYETYGRRPEPNPTVNFSFVITLVMVGLTIVLAIPYMLMRRRAGPAGKGYAPVATTFAQVIQQSKKRQSGHVH